MRASSDLLLVGSLPVPGDHADGSATTADLTERTLRTAAPLFGDRLFALPDGEAGPRGAWVAFDRTTLLEPHDDIEVIAPTTSPTGRARHAYDTARLTVHAGIGEIRFDSWERVPETIASYGIFRRLRDGEPGLRRRHATASRHLADFGVAMYCGFGRQQGQDPAATMREHAETVSAVR